MDFPRMDSLLFHLFLNQNDQANSTVMTFRSQQHLSHHLFFA